MAFMTTSNSLNSLSLQADLVEREPLRITPAGVPVFKGRVAHQSIVSEAGKTRTVELEVEIQVVGETARLFERLALGAKLELIGFLAPIRKNSHKLVFHIQEFSLVSSAL